jgi:kynureninase
VSLHHPHADLISQALIARGVVPDYRTPGRLRLGLAPVTTRFTDVWDALDCVRQISPGLAAGPPPAGPG